MSESQAQGRDGQVATRIKSLTGEIDRLKALADQLCERLTTVTRAIATSEAVAKEQPKEQLVPLADELRSLSEKIGRVNYVLDTLRTGIEL